MRRLYLDLYAASATPAQREHYGWPDPIDDTFERDLQRARGRRFEATVHTAIRKAGVRCIEDVVLDQRALATGHPHDVIWVEPRIARNAPHGQARPDLVRVEPDGAIRIIEIKAAPEVGRTHEAELAYYAWRIRTQTGMHAGRAITTQVLCAGTLAPTPYAAPALAQGSATQGPVDWTRSATPVETKLADGALSRWIRTVEALGRIAPTLHGTWRTAPQFERRMGAGCAHCPWLRSTDTERPGCWQEARDEDALERIEGLRTSEAQALKAHGIARASTLARTPKEVLARDAGLGQARAARLTARAQALCGLHRAHRMEGHPGAPDAWAARIEREHECARLLLAVQLEPGATHAAGVGWRLEEPGRGTETGTELADAPGPNERRAMLKPLHHDIARALDAGAQGLSIALWSERERAALRRSVAESADGSTANARLRGLLDGERMEPGDHLHLLAPSLATLAVLPVALTVSCDRAARALRTGRDPDADKASPGRLDDHPRLRDVAWRTAQADTHHGTRKRAMRRIHYVLNDLEDIERWIRAHSTRGPRTPTRSRKAHAHDTEGLARDVMQVIAIEDFHAQCERDRIAALRMRPLVEQVESGDAVIVGEPLGGAACAIADGAERWRNAEKPPGLAIFAIETPPGNHAGIPRIEKRVTPARLAVEAERERITFEALDPPQPGEAVGEWPHYAGDRRTALLRAGAVLGGPTPEAHAWWPSDDANAPESTTTRGGTTLLWPTPTTQAERTEREARAQAQAHEHRDLPPWLTRAQRTAAIRALAHRISTVHGPPGTGKSACAGAIAATLARTIERETGRKATIALAAPTWRACKAIALAAQDALSKQGTHVHRLWQGAPAHHPPPEGWHPHTRARLGRGLGPRETREATLLIAGTARQLGRAPEGTFDLIVLDEAAQATPADLIVLAATAHADTHLVAAGDPLQLGPVRIRPHSAEAAGHAHSAWTRIVASGAPTTMLDRTFRAGAAITALIRAAGYDGAETRLESAVPGRHLDAQAIADDAPPWARTLLDPAHPLTVVLWRGHHDAARIESQWMATLARALEGTQVGLIAWHRRHVTALKRAMTDTTTTPGTVDALQGAERDVVLLGLGIDDIQQAIAEETFVLDPRRLNVAWSRARSKVVVIANESFAAIVPTREAEQAREGLALLHTAIALAGPSSDLMLPSPDENAPQVQAWAAGVTP